MWMNTPKSAKEAKRRMLISVYGGKPCPARVHQLSEKHLLSG